MACAGGLPNIGVGQLDEGAQHVGDIQGVSAGGQCMVHPYCMRLQSACITSCTGVTGAAVLHLTSDLQQSAGTGCLT